MLRKALLIFIVLNFSRCNVLTINRVYHDNKGKGYIYFNQDSTFFYHQVNKIFDFDTYCSGKYRLIKNNKAIICYDAFKPIKVKVNFLYDGNFSTDSARIITNLDAVTPGFKNFSRSFQILENDSMLFNRLNLDQYKVNTSQIKTLQLFSTFETFYISQKINPPSNVKYNVIEIIANEYDFLKYGRIELGGDIDEIEGLKKMNNNELLCDTIIFKLNSVKIDGYKYKKAFLLNNFYKRNTKKLHFYYFNNSNFIRPSRKL